MSETKTNFQRVQEFHSAMQHETRGTRGDSPGWPDFDRVQMRLDLISEEVDELREEVDNTPIAPVNRLAINEIPHQERKYRLRNAVKEACDLLYVTYGLLDELGVDADAAFAEVHRSNMSKLDENGNPIRREDGKILKGPRYSPADMSKVCGDE